MDPMRLHFELVQAGIPIDGVNSNGIISFKAEVTDQQRADAQAIVDNFDWSEQAAIDYQNEIDVQESIERLKSDKVLQSLIAVLGIDPQKIIDILNQ